MEKPGNLTVNVLDVVSAVKEAFVKAMTMRFLMKKGLLNALLNGVSLGNANFTR